MAVATNKHISYVKNRVNMAEKKKNIPPKHNHEVCLEATKFSPVICKFDQDDLGLIERLYDNGLRTKDIFSVLNLSLNEIEVLFKTLQDDENILYSIATKTAHIDECDQDSKFIQAIFWPYRHTISQFAVAKDLKKDIEIDEFMQALQKLIYRDISVDEVEQEIAELWKQFPNAKSYMNET
ncbi:37983_t:CDS:2 [Gigaspora margarita]|uniref:37983_t:CDS:1 n=1 Tax=Gigaspora margarita TaxID=4874 RepID=A0ABN7VKQ3_GIGMA|nr:37983_t:CDS:2 [Gigaspora margarita]